MDIVTGEEFLGTRRTRKSASARTSARTAALTTTDQLPLPPRRASTNTDDLARDKLPSTSGATNLSLSRRQALDVSEEQVAASSIGWWQVWWGGR